MSTLVSASVRVRWAAIGAAIAVSLGGGALGVVHATTSSGERAVFVPITPCRLFDTRADQTAGPRHVPLGGGETFTQPVRGHNGNCDVAADADGVAMNVTVVNGTVASFLTVWPADAGRPLASSLNWVANAPPTPNKVDVKLSATGTISLFNNVGTVDVLADVVGYYVDHNHDDRYYTKDQVYTKAELDNRTVRLSVDPTTAQLSQGNPLKANDCASATLNNGTMTLPLSLPIGARLLNIDIAFYDGFDSTLYRAWVQRWFPAPEGMRLDQIASTSGGAGSGGNDLVNVHVTPTTPTTVAEGEWYEILFAGMAGGANGICSVTVEYDPAP